MTGQFRSEHTLSKFLNQVVNELFSRIDTILGCGRQTRTDRQFLR